MAAGDAYNLGQALRRARDRQEAIAAYRKAAELDPSYEDRAYFNSELAGILFESEDFEVAAARYARALELGADPFAEALLADALLWSGRYGDAEAALSLDISGTSTEGGTQNGDSSIALSTSSARWGEAA